MKKLYFLIGLLLMQLSSFGQTPVELIANKEMKLFTGVITRNTIATINVGDTIKVTAYNYIGSAFQVYFNNQIGFIDEYKLSDYSNFEDLKKLGPPIVPPLQPSQTSRPRTNSYTQRRNDLTRYKERYGQPDDIYEYESRSYKSITYEWNCAGGKYRKITFVLKSGRYVKYDEFTSSCIR